jgi:hypothetical protein
VTQAPGPPLFDFPTVLQEHVSPARFVCQQAGRAPGSSLSKRIFLALVRQALAVLAAACLLATGEAAASTMRVRASSTALATTVVSGPAGAKVHLSLDRMVQMNWLGLDSTVSASTGRWTGVLVDRTDVRSQSDTDWYLRYDLTQAELCLGRRCPLDPFSHGVFGGNIHNTGNRSGSLQNGPYTFELPAGSYTVVLLGDPGTRVVATLHLHGLPGGVLRLTAHEHAQVKATFFRPKVTIRGQDVVSRGYVWDTGRTQRFDGLAVGFALSRPAVANFSWCYTFGAPDSQACLGGGDVTGGNPLLLTHVGGYAYGAGYSLATSLRGGGVGLGYDAEAVAASSRLVALHFSVSGV